MMVNVSIGIVFVIACFYVDFEMIKQEKSLKAWVVYGSLSGIGIALFLLYSLVFTITSPLSFIDNWLHPMTRWLSK
jgi:hypothetical protein